MHQRYPEYEKEIYDVISLVKGNRLKISKEKTKKGRKLYSPIDMNKQFENAFQARGFSEIRDTYNLFA